MPVMGSRIQYLASITIWVLSSWIRLSFLSHFTTAHRPQRCSPRCVPAFDASPNVIPERKSFQTTPSFHPRCSRFISKIGCFTALV
ncbi:hypothetical protein B0H13DRAFT_1972391 [Mycena leptocephala]|nr:hypothetical protein B0H13DRAFT_1972391 [Mycena leptocephala]